MQGARAKGEIEYQVSMNFRTLLALWKANVPHWVLIAIQLCLGAVILGLEGVSPEWVPLGIFLATVVLGQSIAEFAGTYADRDEDQLYGPTNPIVTGELDARTAKKFLIGQNIVAGAFGLALVVVTLNYALVIAMIVCWFITLAYSLPPFQIKRTISAPFFPALGEALLLIVGWLLVEASLTAQDGFIIAFAAFLFLYTYGFVITLKFRKTYLALNAGLIEAEQDSGICSLRTVDLGMKVKTAVALETTTILGAFILVPIFWHLEIFDMPLSIGLLALSLPLTLAGIVLRIKGPIENSVRVTQLITLGWILVHFLFFAVALNSLVHWGYALLTGIVLLTGFLLLLWIVHPRGSKSIGSY